MGTRMAVPPDVLVLPSWDSRPPRTSPEAVPGDADSEAAELALPATVVGFAAMVFAGPRMNWAGVAETASTPCPCEDSSPEGGLFPAEEPKTEMVSEPAADQYLQVSVFRLEHLQDAGQDRALLPGL